jgi:hypothetical protein
LPATPLRCTPSTYSGSVAETSNGLQRGDHSKAISTRHSSKEKPDRSTQRASWSDLNPALLKHIKPRQYRTATA